MWRRADSSTRVHRKRSKAECLSRNTKTENTAFRISPCWTKRQAYRRPTLYFNEKFGATVEAAIPNMRIGIKKS
jgi:hypothetical protein